MLRKIRIALEVLFFCGITLLFLGIGYDWLGWMADIQLLPSITRVAVSASALNIGILLGIFLLTFIFGRIYCSFICPLGVLQDIIVALRRRLGGKQKFSLLTKLKYVRTTILAIYIVSFSLGSQAVISLLAPYSAYGRMVSSLLGSWTSVSLVAALSFVVIVVLSWAFGRIWCIGFCPVGTLLSLASKHSLLKLRVDHEKCVSCGLCGKKCKAWAIDTALGKINYENCIVCFDCIGNCHSGAISYGPEKKKAHNAADPSRRAFLVGTALVAGSLTLKAEEEKLDGGLAAIEKKKRPERTESVVPAGAFSTKRFYRTCTACQLCVSACPFGVLTPSKDPEHFMQPEMNFAKDYCHTGCTRCAEVCPTDAIASISAEDKTGIHFGRACVDMGLCTLCGNCVRHCPSGALRMVPKNPDDPKAGRTLVVFEEKCTGCGACEHVCPTRPYSAIHVNGLSVHIID